jgi:uncharacterized membrane protein
LTRAPAASARRSRRGVALASACALLLAAAGARPARGAPPRSCEVGAYLIALYDFDFARGSFGADLWLWSRCPTAELRPLDVMDFVDAIEVRRSLAATSERGGIFWSYVKVSGTFRHTWDVRNYPFDRHELRIVGENTDSPAGSFGYVADREGSKPSRDIRLDGWKITAFSVDAWTYVYDTIFGDPAFEGEHTSDYSRLVISTSLARTKLLGFLKLVAGVYVAFALSALAFLLGPYNGRRRTNLLVGTLFAVLVNQRVAESQLGRTESVTMIDEIHVLAMVYIFAIALAGIWSQILFDRNRQEEAVRFDIRGLWITTVSYVALNLALVWKAAVQG